MAKKRRMREDGRLTRKDHRLVARWCPVGRDLFVDLHPRFSSADLGWLMDEVFTKEVRAEFERRGYDLASLRFHIDKIPEAVEKHEALAGRKPAAS